MPDIHRVADVHEAVALASTFKRDGRYDWFRGQLQNWPLRSSIARLAQGEQEEGREKLGRFSHWAKTTPGLESLGTNIATFWAVAQHYGLPTNYIDFTTSLDFSSCVFR